MPLGVVKAELLRGVNLLRTVQALVITHALHSTSLEDPGLHMSAREG